MHTSALMWRVVMHPVVHTSALLDEEGSPQKYEEWIPHTRQGVPSMEIRNLSMLGGF